MAPIKNIFHQKKKTTRIFLDLLKNKKNIIANNKKFFKKKANTADADEKETEK